MSAGSLKIDLHVHTCYSSDGITTLKEVVAFSKRRGLNGVAITDHGTVAGALRLSNAKGLIVIPGVEIETSHGHLLALNVTKPIPSKLSHHEIIERIHDEGGIAVAAHPIAISRIGWKPRTLEQLNLDAIEVINSATFPFAFSTRLSRNLAVRFNLPQTAGSDSHMPETIGMAYTLIDAGPETDEIIEAIRRGATVPRGKAKPWALRLKKSFMVVKKGFRA